MDKDLKSRLNLAENGITEAQAQKLDVDAAKAGIKITWHRDLIMLNQDAFWECRLISYSWPSSRMFA